VFYISEYSVSRHYGGPEEGGWWYDIREFVKTWAAYTDGDDALTVCRRLNVETQEAEREDRHHYGRGSVLGGEDCEWTVERHPAEEDNTREPRPHYE
jgi:hypothetical protein